jgi:maleate cis-trans isomerase
MLASRREFLRLSAALAATGAIAGTASAKDPTAGLIFPPLNYPIPPDAKRLFPTGLRFISNGVGLPGGMTIKGYEEAIPRVVPRAQDLAREGADLISVFGSSLTFFRGAAFGKELTDRVTEATGRPATTQSNGLVDGLKHVNAKRVAIAAAYTDTVTERLKVFLEEHGFTIVAAKGLGYERIPQARRRRLQRLAQSRCSRHVLRSSQNARLDRAARGIDRRAGRVVNAARAVALRADARTQSSHRGVRHRHGHVTQRAPQRRRVSRIESCVGCQLLVIYTSGYGRRKHGAATIITI